ncbi:pyrrolidone-carboxylate peptidase [Weizmannia acidilactici]|uniref:Pyrrolidone-carboxylate peptidase n=1 Tax=Weizmannia acidilactici TaxID=2607726 RepID=A0A5J4JKT8_9BACI|nr:pyroglutamyl-peptidase I [Weizmannia acidilactici]GER67749.1 pyrrolidone-carboxylate peptidase [Weizmannia acidilactici]GER71849.1 pyrrolidone-carboxylate peptidase [Weizmannia acidilactici]GER73626.1 pyrrolidone-carboxylate peptidase [Weizmannia acidilactici]
MGKKVLLTGFEPFGGDKLNPALEAIKQLDGRNIEGIRIVTQQVPTVFYESIRTVTEAIDRHQPDVVICVGQAGGRAQITPERVAINIDDARIPDNKQQQPVDVPIEADGPAAYWSTLPIKMIVSRLREAGIPSAVSNSAGTFVCNHLFYGVLHYLEKNKKKVRAGFIHIPYIPEQTTENGDPSMALDTIVKALEIVAVVSATTEKDIAETGGALH